MNIFEETSLTRPALAGEEKFVLSRKNGKLALKVKSPLFERYFRDQARGEVGPPDPVWGLPLYKVEIDPVVDRELSQWGVSFKGVEGVWLDRTAPPRQRRPGGGGGARVAANPALLEYVDPNQPYQAGPNIQFNISFLLARGLEGGLKFDLKDQVPLSLVEGPSFTYTTTLRQGLFHVMKQFLFDYEATVVIQSDVRV